jgi:hypothetical protein
VTAGLRCSRENPLKNGGFKHKIFKPQTLTSAAITLILYANACQSRDQPDLNRDLTRNHASAEPRVPYSQFQLNLDILISSAEAAVFQQDYLDCSAGEVVTAGIGGNNERNLE